MKPRWSIWILWMLFLSIIGWAQEPLSPDWTTPAPIPDNGGSATGNVGNNMGILSSGKLLLIFTETNTSGVSRLYLTTTNDDGQTWTAPVLFPPATSLIGAYSPTVVVDQNDVFHVILAAHGPVEGLYYTSTSDSGATWSAPIRISDTVRYKIAYDFISTDRSGRLHAMWHDGDTDTDSLIAEVMYTRSLDGGLTWETPRRLSSDDGEHSAFPRADFTPSSGDTLVIAWRDARPAGDDWDVYGAISYDGGATWTEQLLAGGPGRQWDPMVQIDQNGVIHLGVMEYPANHLIDVFVWYTHSTDGGNTWSTPQTMRGARSIFPIFTYDPIRHILWYFLRIESPPGPNATSDLGVRYSFDGGNTWSNVERLTMVDPGNGTKYPAIATGVDGIVRVFYSMKDSLGNDKMYFQKRKSVPTATGVNSGELSPPEGFELGQNYPNPFNPVTNVEFRLSNPAWVRLKIYDLMGRKVKTLVNGRRVAGTYTVVWDGTDDTGKPVVSGVYFYRLWVNNRFVATRKMLLIR